MQGLFFRTPQERQGSFSTPGSRRPSSTSQLGGSTEQTPLQPTSMAAGENHGLGIDLPRSGPSAFPASMRDQPRASDVRRSSNASAHTNGTNGTGKTSGTAGTSGGGTDETRQTQLATPPMSSEARHAVAIGSARPTSTESVTGLDEASQLLFDNRDATVRARPKQRASSDMRQSLTDPKTPSKSELPWWRARKEARKLMQPHRRSNCAIPDSATFGRLRGNHRKYPTRIRDNQQFHPNITQHPLSIRHFHTEHLANQSRSNPRPWSTLLTGYVWCADAEKRARGLFRSSAQPI